MACRGSQTAFIQFLGGAAAGQSGARASYEQHVREAVVGRSASGPRSAGNGAQAVQRAQANQACDSAEASVGRATSPRAVADAVESAKRAVANARRAGGDRRQLLTLERKLAAVQAKADAKDREFRAAEDDQQHRHAHARAVSHDPLSPFSLGVTLGRTSSSPKVQERARALGRKAFGYSQLTGDVAPAERAKALAVGGAAREQAFWIQNVTTFKLSDRPRDISPQLSDYLDQRHVWKKGEGRETAFSRLHGSGSTADALRTELETARPVRFDVDVSGRTKMHGRAAVLALGSLADWLDSNPAAPSNDRRAVVEIMVDLRNSLPFSD